MLATAAVFVLLLVFIQVRAGVGASELLADPSQILDVSGATHHWTGDRPEHAGSFAFEYRNATGPARWPCGYTIRWAVNPAGADDNARADLREAIARVSAVSGARFRYVGTTDMVPSTAARSIRGADLVVAWATPEHTDALANDAREGVLGTTLTSHRGAVITRAAIVVNLARAGHYSGGFGRGETRGRILLHELGHVMGLGHVGDSTQVMAPRASGYYPAAYGAGDLTGLAIAGCR